MYINNHAAYAYVHDFNNHEFQADYQLEILEEKISRCAELGFKSLTIGCEINAVHGEIKLNSEIGKHLYKVNVDYIQDVKRDGRTTTKKRNYLYCVYADNKDMAISLFKKHKSDNMFKQMFSKSHDFEISVDKISNLPGMVCCYAI